MILTFDGAGARALLEVSKASENRRPNFVQLCDPDLWRDDLRPDRRAELAKSLEEDGYPAGISEADIDPAKLPAGLWIVGDQGVYLMSNAPIAEVKVAGHKHVAYAREVDPETMGVDDWWEAKRRSFGGDDGADFVDAETLEQALTGETLEIDMTPTSMAILKPRDETPEP